MMIYVVFDVRHGGRPARDARHGTVDELPHGRSALNIGCQLQSIHTVSLVGQQWHKCSSSRSMNSIIRLHMPSQSRRRRKTRTSTSSPNEII